MWATEAKGVIKWILPARILGHLRAYRDLDGPGRSAYWASQRRRADPVGGWNSGAGWSAIRSVVFVCRGNIIRSPMAAALLRRDLSENGRTTIAVHSAGLRAELGRGADSRAVEAARHFGISLEDHCARPLTPELARDADLIVVMDALNEAELLGRYPAATDRVLMLGVVDPYDGDGTDIRRCYELLQSSIERLARRLGPSAEVAGEARER